MTPEQSVVPYDENLLERARTQWEFGDWQSLAKLDRETLQHHPERAKLALLAAAGRLQLDKTEEARQFVCLAQDWGLSKRLIARVLISGVYNCLARAAALAGQRERAIKNFERAVDLGSTGADTRLILKARIAEQLGQLGLISRGADWLTPAVNQQPVLRAVNQAHENLTGARAQSDLETLRIKLEKSIAKQVANATKQLEALLEIHNYFNDGELTGALHGWPVSPDFALKMIELLDAGNYDLVIEFGSGTSTVLMAKVLARKTTGRGGTIRQVAFEHLEEYYDKTLAELRRVGLDANVDLVLAPLHPYKANPAGTALYYSCEETLKKIAKEFDLQEMRIFVLVDGPPQPTGKHARYPALPCVATAFPAAKIDVLLDDYSRADEIAIVEMWCKEARENGYVVNLARFDFEKGAAFLRIERPEAQISQ
jgi:hypothetical protein